MILGRELAAGGHAPRALGHTRDLPGYAQAHAGGHGQAGGYAVHFGMEMFMREGIENTEDELMSGE